jgi:hypothetical protein
MLVSHVSAYFNFNNFFVKMPPFYYYFLKNKQSENSKKSKFLVTHSWSWVW